MSEGARSEAVCARAGRGGPERRSSRRGGERTLELSDRLDRPINSRLREGQKRADVSYTGGRASLLGEGGRARQRLRTERLASSPTSPDSASFAPPPDRIERKRDGRVLTVLHRSPPVPSIQMYYTSVNGGR